MEIIEKFLTKNPMSRPGTPIHSIKKITIHWVGNARSSAIANRNYFENLKSQSKIYASSHYIIGLEGEIIQCVPENEIAYHGNNHNSYAIGIENCHPDWEGKFNDKTYHSLIMLCADLCKRYQLNPLTALERHYDITGKDCPHYYVKNTKAWEQLKKDVQIALQAASQDTELENAITLLIRKGVKIDKESWNNLAHMNCRYGKTLITRIGATLFHTTSYEATIQKLAQTPLKQKHIINQIDMWQDSEHLKATHIRQLLLNIAQYLN